MSSYSPGNTFYNSAMRNNASNSSYPEELDYASYSNQLNTQTPYNLQSQWSSRNSGNANGVTIPSTDLEDMNGLDQTRHQPSAAVNGQYRVQDRPSRGILQHNPPELNQIFLNQSPAVYVSVPANEDPLVAGPEEKDNQQFHNPAECSGSLQIQDDYPMPAQDTAEHEYTVSNDGTNPYNNFTPSGNQAQLTTFLAHGYLPPRNHQIQDDAIINTPWEDMNMQTPEAMGNEPLDISNSVEATTITGNNQICPPFGNRMGANLGSSGEEFQFPSNFNEVISLPLIDLLWVVLKMFEVLVNTPRNVPEGTYFEESTRDNNEPSPAILPQETATREENPTPKEIQPPKSKVGRTRKNKLQASTNNEEVPTTPKRKRGRSSKTTNTPQLSTNNEEVPTTPKRKRGSSSKITNTTQSSTIENLTITSPTQTNQNYVTKDRQAKRRLMAPDFSFNEEPLPGCSGTSTRAKRKEPEDKDYLPDEDLSEEELPDEDLSEEDLSEDELPEEELPEEEQLPEDELPGEMTSTKTPDEIRREKNRRQSKASRDKLRQRLALQDELYKVLLKDNKKLKECNKGLKEALEIIQNSNTLN